MSFGTSTPKKNITRKRNKVKNHGICRDFFVCVIIWCYPPQIPTQETFREKFLGTSKASPKQSGVVRAKFLRIFKELFQKFLKARFGTQFQHITKNKKRGFLRVFCVHYQLGLSAPNPDTRNFSRKVSWNFKSFTKIKWCIRCEVLWHTFLRKKGVFFCLLFL